MDTTPRKWTEALGQVTIAETLIKETPNLASPFLLRYSRYLRCRQNVVNGDCLNQNQPRKCGWRPIQHQPFHAVPLLRRHQFQQFQRRRGAAEPASQLLKHPACTCASLRFPTQPSSLRFQTGAGKSRRSKIRRPIQYISPASDKGIKQFGNHPSDAISPLGW